VVYKNILYISLTTLGMNGPEKIILLSSNDHRTHWNFVGTLLDQSDAKKYGFKYFDGSSLAIEDERPYLLVSPGRTGLEHDGTYVIPFADITQGKLAKREDGSLQIDTHFQRDAALSSGQQGAGQSTYHEKNNAGGLILPQFDMKSMPRVFQLFSTGYSLSGRQER
jgi:hypothetical protein